MTLRRKNRRTFKPTRLLSEQLEDRRMLATFVVNNPLDANIAGTLRSAVAAANLIPGHDTIQFSLPPATILLPLGELAITDDLTIEGPGSANLTLTSFQNVTTFRVHEGNNVSISGLTISGGGGNGITNHGTLTVSNSIISNHRYNGIKNLGTLTVRSSTISGNGDNGIEDANLPSNGMTTVRNSNVSGNGGSGIYSRRPLTVIGTTISNNWRGIDVSREEVTLTTTTVRSSVSYGLITGSTSQVTIDRGNFSNNGAEGIFNRGNAIIIDGTVSDNDGSGVLNSGTMLIDQSTITGNSADAGGGVLNRGTLTLRDSTVSQNSALEGGGVVNAGLAGTANATIEGSTISQNYAQGYGGGVWNDEQDAVLVTNSTISSNTSMLAGGGIVTAGETTIQQSTITANVATDDGDGLLRRAATGSLSVGSSIIAGNGNGLDVGGGGGLINSAGYNLIGGGSLVSDFAAAGDQVGVAPGLGPLADNGGLTQTHAPVFDSLAINAGDPMIDGAGEFDQRGAPFARVVGGRLDAGAFEFRGTIEVDTLADESDGDYRQGDLSLREALTLVEARAQDETITFASGLSGTLNLGLGELPVYSGNNLSISIQGPGSDQLTIQVDPYADDPRAFRTSGNVEISGMTISGGNADSGGAIYNQWAGHLRLEDMVLTGNTAIFHGGAVLNDGILEIHDSQILANSANSGGAIANQGYLQVNDSVIRDNTANYGGGLFSDGPFDIENTLFSQNTATDGGGGIWISNSLSYANGGPRYAKMRNSTVVGNSAGEQGGGLAFGENSFNAGGDAVLAISTSTISGNSSGNEGGGLWASQAGAGSQSRVLLDQSTIAANQAINRGGGIFFQDRNFYEGFNAQLEITSSTISGNSVNLAGGGLFAYGRTMIRYATITDNTAGESGAGVFARESTAVRATIVAGNAGSDDLAAGFYTEGSAFNSYGYNVVGSGETSGFQTGSDQVIGDADPGLAPLADNGGPTPTHALLPDSPALDVIEVSLENFARDGFASQSSQLSSFTAGRGIDGDLTNFTHTESADMAPHWQVELDQASLLSEITLHNRDSCCASRLRDITVQVLDGEGQVVFESPLLNPENELGNGQLDQGPETLTVDLVAATGGRLLGKTVKVLRTPDPDLSGVGMDPAANDGDFSVLSLGEVEVMGLDGVPQFDQRGEGFERVVNGRIDVGAFELAPAPTCDFNADEACDIADIDLLVAEIVAGTHDAVFDLTGDGLVDLADRDQWLADAGSANLPSGNAYLVGDANLDGVVDGVDFILWNNFKFSDSGTWSQGDFNADGVTDGQDFLLWNNNKFLSADNANPRTTNPLDAVFADLAEEEDESVGNPRWRSLVRG